MSLSFLRRPLPAPRLIHQRSALCLRPLGWVAVVLLLAPSPGRPCACGCGIYAVGTSDALPSGTGGTAFLDFAYQDQDRNWTGDSAAPAAENPDKDIRTTFLSAGFQEVLSPSWSCRLDVPYEYRHFETTGGATGSDLVSLNFSGFGDVRLQATYTGFDPGLTTGVSFGLKLPTGTFTQNDAYGDIDRDTELGSGSTDLLLGAFRRFGLDAAYDWNAYVQGLLDVPVLTQDGYRPGMEFDAAFGVYYSGWSLGRLHLTPTGLVKAAVRSSDGGPGASQPVASGFERLILAPGLGLAAGQSKLYADVEVPVLQHFTGEQLASSVLFRVEVSYAF